MRISAAWRPSSAIVRRDADAVIRSVGKRGLSEFFIPWQKYLARTRGLKCGHRRTDRVAAILDSPNGVVSKWELKIRNFELAVHFSNSFEQYSYLWLGDRHEYLNQFLKYGKPLTPEEEEIIGKLDEEGQPIIKETSPKLEDYKAQIDMYEEIYKEVDKIPPSKIIFNWLRVDVRPFKQDMLNNICKWSMLFKQHLMDYVVNRELRTIEKSVLRGVENPWEVGARVGGRNADTVEKTIEDSVTCECLCNEEIRFSVFSSEPALRISDELPKPSVFLRGRVPGFYPSLSCFSLTFPLLEILLGDTTDNVKGA
ncbi:unnamed protein product [Bemisia tabaci]|uniref:Uncharacterized protein n=1 Tax=Bemisia tabaci TaxID=7038 RepID=A0A9P0A7I9_BEMTA|nr:unnamed protein product [Bemisia tabaci]